MKESEWKKIRAERNEFYPDIENFDEDSFDWDEYGLEDGDCWYEHESHKEYQKEIWRLEDLAKQKDSKIEELKEENLASRIEIDAIQDAVKRINRFQNRKIEEED